jgi:hypothetical protein
MKPARYRWVIYLAALAWVISLYAKRIDLDEQFPVRKLRQADTIYTELAHPDWSTRILREKSVLPNLGSGDHRMIYLIDVRRVSIPREEAIAWYGKETDRLGFRECHVDSYQRASEKFADWEWQRLGIAVPRGDDIVIISQNFSSDSTVRAHPAETR